MNKFAKKTSKATICGLLLSAVLISTPGFAANSHVFRHPDTPFLPPFCGTVVSGDVNASPQGDGGIIYTITFETTERPDSIINWYRGAFQQNGWALAQECPGQYSINAQHGKNINSSISLSSPKRKSASAQVRLYYRYVGRDI
jgi:hypothetical protein